MSPSAAAEREDAQEENQSAGRRPIFKLRDGTSSVAVFANQGDNGVFHTIKMDHAYKDSDGNYKPSNSFTAQEAATYMALMAAGYSKAVELNQS